VYVLHWYSTVRLGTEYVLHTVLAVYAAVCCVCGIGGIVVDIGGVWGVGIKYCLTT